jgi:hypothetical protein
VTEGKEAATLQHLLNCLDQGKSRGKPVLGCDRTQMLRQGDAKVFKKCSRMKLQMKRDALEKINRHAGDAKDSDTVKVN